LTDKKKKIPGHILFSFNLKTKEIKSFYYQRSFSCIKRETYNEK